MTSVLTKILLAASLFLSTALSVSFYYILFLVVYSMANHFLVEYPIS